MRGFLVYKLGCNFAAGGMMAVALNIIIESQAKSLDWGYKKYQEEHLEMYKSSPTEDSCRLAASILQEISEHIEVRKADRLVVSVPSHKEVLAKLSNKAPMYSDGIIGPLFVVIHKEFTSHSIIRNPETTTIEMVNKSLIL